MNSNIFHRVQRIMTDLFSVTVAEIDLESTPDTVESWDSLQHLNLVLALEQEFGVQFKPEDIEDAISVKSMVDLLEYKLASRSV